MTHSHEVIRAVIQHHWNRLNSTDIRMEKFYNGTLFHMFDRATVQLNLGRGAGHSTYIKNNATPGDLVVVVNRSRAREFPRGNVRTLTEIIDYNVIEGLKLDKVWVDAASVQFQNTKQVEDFYWSLERSHVNQIIMLG